MQMQEMQRQAWLPVADALDRAQAAWSRAVLHGHARAARLLHGRAPIGFIGGPATPHELVSDGPLARLLRYPAQVPAGGKARPLVVVASLINRYYVLDLLPELSVFAGLQKRGFDVWVLDWKAPGAAGATLGFEEYVDGAILGAVAQAARHAGGDSVALLGYCMGGTVATMFAARHPERIKALALLGTPIEFGLSGQLARFTQKEVFDAALLMDVYGNMPPAIMQSGFKAMNPADALFKLSRLYLDAADESKVRQFVALEAWLDDNVAFPGGVYRRYIQALYQDDELVRGRFTLGGEPVRLEKIAAPLLNVIALRDHICAPPASKALMDKVSSTDKQVIEFDTGHIGLTTSRRSHDALWPRIGEWLEART